ncbi:MAG TPA: pseudouridine synthase [Candidatus Limnocylindria bacterium]|nr:pseudouridine synthase [Candidatus Limnocylindria bacterium]
MLASRGIGARRKCDALIQAGSVRVNGRVIREPGTQVEPERDRVEVHGRLIPGQSRMRYLMLNKPVGVLTTLDDPERRRTVREFLPPGPRLFPVGRLDADTSGLLLFTNDGELAHHLMHPRYGLTKVYRAKLDRVPDRDQLRRLSRGVELEPGVVSGPAEVRVRSARPGRPAIEIGIQEGRYRQVRRMCEAVGLSVVALHRARYGPLVLGTLPKGMCRDLSLPEVRRLRAASARPHERLNPRVEAPSALREPRSETPHDDRRSARGRRGGAPRGSRPSRFDRDRRRTGPPARSSGSQRQRGAPLGRTPARSSTSQHLRAAPHGRPPARSSGSQRPRPAPPARPPARSSTSQRNAGSAPGNQTSRKRSGPKRADRPFPRSGRKLGGKPAWRERPASQGPARPRAGRPIGRSTGSDRRRKPVVRRPRTR